MSSSLFELDHLAVTDGAKFMPFRISVRFEAGSPAFSNKLGIEIDANASA